MNASGECSAYTLSKGIRFVLPDLFWAELANVLWKAVRRGRSVKSAAETALRSLGESRFQHYGRNIFRFFCRAASRSTACFSWRSISFCGSSCPFFKDLAIAASACAFSRFENMASAKEFRNLERTRFIEYCESSQRAMTFCVYI